MEIKTKPKRQDIHRDFYSLLIKLQTERIDAGKENSQTQIALWKLTKTISNLIESNPQIFKSLVEVDINGI